MGGFDRKELIGAWLWVSGNIAPFAFLPACCLELRHPPTRWWR